MKRLPFAIMAAGIGMSIAVSLLMLFAAGVSGSPVVSALCLFAASLMTWIPMREDNGYVFALVSFAVVSLAALLISGSSVYTYLYIFVFGNYAIVRYFLVTHIDDRFLTLLFRLLFLNIMTALLTAVGKYAVHVEAETFFPGVSVFLLWALLQTAFLVFMLLYKIFSLLFDSVLRNIVLPRS